MLMKIEVVTLSCLQETPDDDELVAQKGGRIARSVQLTQITPNSKKLATLEVWLTSHN